MSSSGSDADSGGGRSAPLASKESKKNDYGSVVSVGSEHHEIEIEQADTLKKSSGGCCGCSSKKYFVIMAVGATAVVLLCLGLGFGLGLGSNLSQGEQEVLPAASSSGSVGAGGLPTLPSLLSSEPTESSLPLYKDGGPLLSKTQPSPSSLGEYARTAVTVDAPECADIAVTVMTSQNGSAVDAAIAGLFCNGLVNPQSMGVGGGFLMTIYVQRTGQVVTLNARETAPAAATVDMYKGKLRGSEDGPAASGIPGEILGYWNAKHQFGNPELPWADLLQPTIKMCREGIKVANSTAEKLEAKKEAIFKDPGLRSIFVSPATNDTWKAGDHYKRLDLASTLERIAQNGAQEFYSGQTAEKLAGDLQRDGGIITLEDLKNYTTILSEPTSLPLPHSNLTLHSAPLPGGGPILAAILNVLQHYKVDGPKDDRPVLYHRIVEAFKYAYAVRSHLGDPADEDIAKQVEQLVTNITSASWGRSTFLRINDSYTVNDAGFYGGDFLYVPPDKGTAHMSIVAPNGDAVAVTSTVNGVFGSKYLSPSTGIIMNNEMDDFSWPDVINQFGVPPSPANFVRPGKRPLSSMCPTLVLDQGGQVRLAIGGAGGTKITTETAYATIRNVWLKETIKEALDAKRIHHQLMPMRVEYENGLDQSVLDFLQSRGHQLLSKNNLAVLNAVARDDHTGRLNANSDFRKNSGVAGA